jgi:hypothetical protein
MMDYDQQMKLTKYANKLGMKVHFKATGKPGSILVGPDAEKLVQHLSDLDASKGTNFAERVKYHYGSQANPAQSTIDAEGQLRQQAGDIEIQKLQAPAQAPAQAPEAPPPKSSAFDKLKSAGSRVAQTVKSGQNIVRDRLAPKPLPNNPNVRMTTPAGQSLQGQGTAPASKPEPLKNPKLIQSSSGRVRNTFENLGELQKARQANMNQFGGQKSITAQSPTKSLTVNPVRNSGYATTGTPTFKIPGLTTGSTVTAPAGPAAPHSSPNVELPGDESNRAKVSVVKAIRNKLNPPSAVVQPSVSPEAIPAGTPKIPQPSAEVSAVKGFDEIKLPPNNQAPPRVKLPVQPKLPSKVHNVLRNNYVGGLGARGMGLMGLMGDINMMADQGRELQGVVDYEPMPPEMIPTGTFSPNFDTGVSNPMDYSPDSRSTMPTQMMPDMTENPEYEGGLHYLLHGTKPVYQQI